MTYPSLPVDDFGYRPQIIFRGVGKDISQLAFKRPLDSPVPRWNISKYLPTTTRGLTKNSKNFQASLRQVRCHIVSDSLEYWHLTPDWLGHIMLLTCGIMPYSKPNSSLSSGLDTKNGIECHCRPFWKLWLLDWVNVSQKRKCSITSIIMLGELKKRRSEWKRKAIISNSNCASERAMKLKWMLCHTLPWKRRNSIISL